MQTTPDDPQPPELRPRQWRRPLRRGRIESIWTDWYRKPKFLALFALVRIRRRLNQNNIFDNYAPAEVTSARRELVEPLAAKTVRQLDGTWNDPADPLMGSARLRRFGRNTRPDGRAVRPDAATLLHPDPREISRRLLTREEFKPIPFLNLIAASWIQFMTHDWFSHGPVLASPDGDLIPVPLAEDDPLRRKYRAATMFVPATLPDPSRAPDDLLLPPTHLNENTHWWDACQLYGADEIVAKSLRAYTNGGLILDPEGRLPVDVLGVEKTGFRRNWWVGLSMLHELFAREHNAICTMLKASYPDWGDQRLYDTARMINAALMAKIHTVEWTPAVLPNPILETAMRANWSGLLPTLGGALGARLKRALPQKVTTHSPALFGILGGKRDLHGVPYAITEEFVSVYRMHPLLPEELDIRPVGAAGEATETVPLARTRNRAGRQLLDRLGTATLFNTFGAAHPGALTLNNYPRFLQDLRLPGLGPFDLATVDLLRDRERGVPRYNEFRRQLGLKPIRAFEDLTDDQHAVAQLHDIYESDVEALDLMIGCLAEGHRPENFGFGETIFQVFILNASRRLQADRFYTTHYTPEVYTPEGLDHIDTTTMTDLLLTHYPELSATGLPRATTAFQPWPARSFPR